MKRTCALFRAQMRCLRRFVRKPRLASSEFLAVERDALAACCVIRKWHSWLKRLERK